MTTSINRGSSNFLVNNFDLIRLFAALQVIVFHAIDRLSLPISPWILPLSFFHGVPIFFIASGYLVSASYERQSGNWKRYFRNRALRILPGLWTCVWITGALTVALGFRPHQLSDYVWLPAQMLGLIYTAPFLHLFGSGTYNGALWTIPLELQFYILLPIVYALTGRLPKHRQRLFWLIFVLFLLLALVSASVVPSPLSGAETRFNKLLRYSFLPQFYLFLFGALLQRHRVYAMRSIAGKGVYWTAAFLVASYMELNWPSLHVLSLLLLGVATISVAYTIPTLGSWLLRGQDISYGLYIYHGLLINLLVSFNYVGSWQDFFLLLSGTTAVAYLSWHFIERPALEAKRTGLWIGLRPTASV